MSTDVDCVAIHFLVPWTGPLPGYARLFLKSCAANPGVKVTLILDRCPEIVCPDNVHWVLRSGAQIADRINECFGLNLSTIGGHKLCDFKPHYGLIFEDLIAGSPWWGFCDIDLMFGNLRPWIEAELRSGRDVITAHDRIIAGHFTVIRNDADLLRNIGSMVIRPEWKEAFCHPTCQMLDEYPFLDFIQAQGIRLQTSPPLSHCLERHYAPYGITFRFDGSTAELTNRQYGFAVWRDGHVTYSASSQPPTEVLYLHFMGTKRWWHWLWPINPRGSTHSFSAVGYGFPPPQSPLQWQVFHLLRRSTQTAEHVRQAGGAFIRNWFGMERFLRLRRVLISRHRY